MNTPRKPSQTAQLIKVADLPNQKKLVKHDQAKRVTYWIQNPSIDGSECVMSFVGLIKKGDITASEQKLIDGIKQAFERHNEIMSNVNH